MFKFSFTFKITNHVKNGFGTRGNHTINTKLPAQLELCFNKQVNMELFASYTYLAMAAYFARQNVSLPGCQKFFMNQSLEERDHAQKLIDYINLRGNCTQLLALKPPPNQSWDSPLAAFKEALELEKTNTQKLYDLHKLSDELGDQYACILLENDYLENQIEECDTLSRYITELERIGPEGLGIYLFDKQLLEEVKKES